MGLKEKLAAFLDTVGDDDADDTEDIRDEDAPTDTADQVVDGADGIDEDITEDIDESGDGDEDTDGDGDEDTDGDGDGSIQESDVTVEELRASLVKLGAENERLRNRLAELGGDAALTTDLVDDVEDLEDDVEDDIEPTDEEAQADIDAQLKEIEALRGGK